MKTQILTTAFLAFAIGLTFSCKKKDNPSPEADPSANNNTATTTGTSSFTWTENGGSTQVADSAFWTIWSNGTGVRAFKQGYSSYFEINWASQNNTAAGSKALAAGSLTFLKGSATYTNSAASNVNITAFSSNQLSGNFSVVVSGGTITSISGGFNALSKK